MLRFVLYNEFLGTLKIDHDDPIDINALTQTVKRSNNSDGIIYEVVFDIDFIKEGRRFVKEAFEIGGGIDAMVYCDLYILNANSKIWSLYGAGKANYNKNDVGEDKVTINIEQRGIQRKVLNLIKTDVEIEGLLTESGVEIPNTTTKLIPYHSKNIQKATKAGPSDLLEFQQVSVVEFDVPKAIGSNSDIVRDVVVYGQFSTDKTKGNELTQTFQQGFGWSSFGKGLDISDSEGTLLNYIDFLKANPNPRFEVYRAEEAAILSINARLNYVHGIDVVNTGGDVDICGDGALGKTEVHAWFEWRDASDVIKQITHIGEWDMAGCGGGTRDGEYEIKSFEANELNIEIGDKIYIYETFRIFGNYERPGLLSSDGHLSHNFRITPGDNSYIQLVGNTSFGGSIVKTVFLHDAIKRCVQYITNKENCFRSNLLGRIEAGYLVDGKGGLIGITNGNRLRGLDEEPSNKVVSKLKPKDTFEFQKVGAVTFDIPRGTNSIGRSSMSYGQFNTQTTNPNEIVNVIPQNYGWRNFSNELKGAKTPGTVPEYIAFLKANKAPRFELINIADSGIIEIDVNLSYKHIITVNNTGGDVDICGSGALGNIEIHSWFEVRSNDGTIKMLEHIGEWDMAGCGDNERIGSMETKTYNNTLTLEKNDRVYIYETVRIYGSYEEPSLNKGHLSHNFKIQSSGSSYTNLTFDGDTSVLPTETPKKLFSSLEDLSDFANSLFCTGIGFEIDEDGNEILVLEEKEHFYDKNTKLLSLKDVYNVKKKLKSDMYYNKIEFGYRTKIEANATNGVDEQNTLRRSVIPVTNTKGELKVATDIITSGYLIEGQRRLANTTKDSKFDDSVFAVQMIRDGGGFRTKKNEGYDYINNVFSPETIYNIDISPMRNLRNWLKVCASSLIYAIREKILTFSYGEVNYKVVSKKAGEQPIAEDGDVDISGVEPIWDNFIYEFSHPLTNEEYQIIKNNPYGYIEFFDLFGNKLEGFISEDGIEHDSNKGIADFKLLKVYRK